LQVAKTKKGYKLAKWYFGKQLEIPEEWEITSLSNISKQIQDADHQTPKTTESGVPFLTVNDIAQNDPLDFSKASFVAEKEYYDFIKKVKPEKNDILYTRVATVGVARLLEKTEKIVVSSNAVVIKPKDLINSKFLKQFLNFEEIKSALISNKAGTAYNFFSLKQIKEIKIIKPPLSEQKQIASILSNVDDTLQKTNQIIEQTQRLKTGMMQKLLTRGIGHTKFKTVTLCNLMNSKPVSIPNEWEVKPLKELAKINPKSIGKNYEHEYISYIDIGAIEDFQIKRYDELKLEERPSRAQKIIGKNDIIISTVRPYLKGFAIVDDSRKNLVCSTGFAVVKLHDLEDLDFVFNYVKSSFFDNNIYRHMEGISYPAVTSNDIANSPILFPTDKKERIRIGYILSNVDTQIQKEKLHKSNLERLKKGLMQKLLTGQIRVKV